MPYWKNVSETTYEHPADGEFGPWLAAPCDVVEFGDTSPVPGAFEPTDPPNPPVEPAPSGPAQPEE